MLKHPIFLNYEYTTKFIDTSTDLFEFSKRRDRGTKVLNYIADITKANKDFGYQPQVKLEDGITKMWRWMREQD